MAHAIANQGRAHPHIPPPPPRIPGPGGPGILIEVPEGGPTCLGGPTPSPLNKKIGVPTLPFIA